MAEVTRQQVRKEMRRLRKFKGPHRLQARAAYMQSLPDELRFAVARVIAGGEV